MPLHPQAQMFLDQSEGQPPPYETSIADARAMMDGFNALAGEPQAVASVEDREIPGPGGSLRIRVYRPTGDDDLPVTVFYHAGGYVIGSLDSHDSLCRLLANGSGSIVVAVDYRRAPEHRFPAPVEDAFATLQWVAEHAAELGADAGRLAVAGDSVGGGLATIVSILARDAGGPALRLQVMVYPDVEWSFSSPSWEEYGHGYFVTVEIAEWLRETYFNSPSEWDDWRASPLRCPDLSGLPPALLICPEYNLARSDMEAYARRLEEAGVPTTFSLYEGMLMGFWCMGSFIDAGHAAIDEVTSALRGAFATTAAAS
ncbi:MAG TPA: alpha/beta hydrolase [Acidimicrobiia bacterium]